MPGSRALSRLARIWGVVPVVLILALLGLRACLVTHPLDRLAVAAADPQDPPGTVARTGTLYIARGGPVVIGVQSTNEARLVIDDHAGTVKDVHGRGMTRERIVLRKGPVAIRVASRGDARLIWSPVGRRGDLEYLPASSLSPLPPERATFDAWVGAAPLDGVIALGLLLVIVGTALMLARRRLRAVSREVWIAMGAVFVLGCVVRWLGLGAMGQTWDEDVNWAAGRNYITNVVSLDLSPASWIWNFEHPPVMKYLEGIGAQLADGFGPARALSGIWVSIGCALLVPIGKRLYGLRAGVLAAGIATLLPHLVAHGQIVGHEAVTVMWWPLGLLLALGVHDGSPTARQRRLRLAGVGVVIGLAFASRFINGFLGVLCLAIVIEGAPDRRLRNALEGAVIMPLVAVATFLAVWPRLWMGPVQALRESYAKLGQLHTAEPFLGAMTNRPGPDYFLVYLAATLPVLVLAGVCAWLARTAREKSPMRPRAALVVAMWFAAPLGAMVSPVKQDGIRYVLPCVLALAVMSAAGFDWLATLVERKLRRGFLALAAALAVYLVATLVSVHPYYLDYYSELVGGAGQVARRKFAETAWWGEGVAAAVDYVNEHAAPGARVFRNCIEPYHLAWFREDLWQPMTNELRAADWLVAYSPLTRGCTIPPELERVFVVETQGAPLAIVYKRRGG